jgi:hypothetical protein
MLSWFKRSPQAEKKPDAASQQAAGQISVVALTSLQNMEHAEPESKSASEFPGGFEMISHWASQIDRMGCFDQSEQVYLRLVQVMEKFYGPDSKLLLGPLRSLQSLYREQKRSADETSIENRVHAIEQHQHSANDPAAKMVAKYLNTVTSQLINNLNTLDRPLENNPDWPLLYEQVILFGRKLAEFRQLEDAERLYKCLLPMLKESYGEESPQAVSLSQSIQALRYTKAEL